MCLIVSTFVEIKDIPLILFTDFHSGLTKNNSHLLHSDQPVIDLVNIKHVGNRQQDPRSYLVHPVDRFDSQGWFSCNQVIF